MRCLPNDRFVLKADIMSHLTGANICLLTSCATLGQCLASSQLITLHNGGLIHFICVCCMLTIETCCLRQFLMNKNPTCPSFEIRLICFHIGIFGQIMQIKHSSLEIDHVFHALQWTYVCCANVHECA